MRRLIGHLLAVVAVVAASVLAATPGSVGAATGGTTATMTVLPTLSVSQTCSGAIDLNAVRGGPAVTDSCTITFDTNAPSGAALHATDGSDTWALSDGGGQTIADAPAAPGSLAVGTFGACVDSTTVGTDTTMPVTATCPTGDPAWFGLGNSTPTEIAKTTGPLTGSVTLHFGVQVGIAQAPTTYTGQVDFTVTAL